jgi:hypothetical protein
MMISILEQRMIFWVDETVALSAKIPQEWPWVGNSKLRVDELS